MDSGVVGLYLGEKKKALRRNLPEFGDGDEGDRRPGRVTQTFYLVVQSKMHPASVRRTGVKGPGLRLKHGIFLGNTKMSSMKEQ